VEINGVKHQLPPRLMALKTNYRRDKTEILQWKLMALNTNYRQDKTEILQRKLMALNTNYRQDKTEFQFYLCSNWCLMQVNFHCNISVLSWR
jgi:hypothetical protein